MIFSLSTNVPVVILRNRKQKHLCLTISRRADVEQYPDLKTLQEQLRLNSVRVEGTTGHASVTLLPPDPGTPVQQMTLGDFLSLRHYPWEEKPVGF